MARLPGRQAAMADAMEIACQVIDKYGEDDIEKNPGLPKLIQERRLPFDHPVFQAAYASICYERGLVNQYITLGRF